MLIREDFKKMATNYQDTAAARKTESDAGIDVEVDEDDVS